jgi:FMN-dependent oxidoreductase (nitrilotriacetate monooxygenase family)
MRTAHYIVFLTPGGYHEAGWRMHDAGTGDPIGMESFARSAATAERGLLDAAFFADRLAIASFRVRAFPQAWQDPLLTLAALAMTTREIGLIATASTTFSTPFDLARRLATLDHLSHGRVGWNVVTTYDPKAAGNFGQGSLTDHDDRYARAIEFVDVVRRLWDSWEDDALVADPARGVWADTDRIHPVDFHGDHYAVTGPLNVPRPPQGHPVLAQAGSSPAGIALAGRTADLVFTPQVSVRASLAFREKIDAAAIENGRRTGDVRILPGLAYVLGSTEREAQARRRELEEAVDPEFRWRNLANNAGLDDEQIDPTRPLTPELAATASNSSFAKHIVGQAMETRLPFGELAATLTGLPGGLEFTGTPEQLADLVQEWVTAGASDGFTLQPTVLPDALDLFVDHVVPILQQRGLFRRAYEGSTLRDHLGLARPEVCEETRARRWVASHTSGRGQQSEDHS